MTIIASTFALWVSRWLWADTGLAGFGAVPCLGSSGVKLEYEFSLVIQRHGQLIDTRRGGVLVFAANSDGI